MGIEPTWPAWKAGALPLSYTRTDTEGNGWEAAVNVFPGGFKKVYLVSDGGRSADFPVRSKLLSRNRAANRVQVGVRTMLRTGKSALRDLRPTSLIGYAGLSAKQIKSAGPGRH